MAYVRVFASLYRIVNIVNNNIFKMKTLGHSTRRRRLCFDPCTILDGMLFLALPLVFPGLLFAYQKAHFGMNFIEYNGSTGNNSASVGNKFRVQFLVLTPIMGFHHGICPNFLC